MPVVEKVPKEQVVYSVLHHAKDFKQLPELCAILILGAGNLTEERETTEYERFCWFFRRKVKRKVVVDRKSALAREISLNVSPSVIFDCIIGRLQDMEIPSFFAITTSLSEVNLLKPTKEVED